MNYLLILQDETVYQVSRPKISMIKWGRRKSEPTLTVTNLDDNYIAVPCSMIKELTPIK